MTDHALFVHHAGIGESFIASNWSVPWNKGGTATVWDVIYPIKQKRIVWGSDNANLIIIEVLNTAIPPELKVGAHMLVPAGKSIIEVIGSKWQSNKPVELYGQVRVVIYGYDYDLNNGKWYYIVRPQSVLPSLADFWCVEPGDLQSE